MQRLRTIFSLIIGLLAIEMIANDTVQQRVSEPDTEIIIQPDTGRHTHHWVATDALGSEVAAFEEAGSLRNGKVVGVFLLSLAGVSHPRCL